MKADRPLSEHVGKNEKTKVVVKLQPKNQGPPIREPALTEEQQAQMMLLSFRRKQELEVGRQISLLLKFNNNSCTEIKSAPCGVCARVCVCVMTCSMSIWRCGKLQTANNHVEDISRRKMGGIFKNILAIKWTMAALNCWRPLFWNSCR